MQKPENCILTIFGASGDLTKRKLIPALFDLFLRNLMPEKFSVLGTGRTKFSDDSFRESMYEALKKYYSKQKVDKSMLLEFLKNIYPMRLHSVIRRSGQKHSQI